MTESYNIFPTFTTGGSGQSTNGGSSTAGFQSVSTGIGQSATSSTGDGSITESELSESNATAKAVIWALVLFLIYF